MIEICTVEQYNEPKTEYAGCKISSDALANQGIQVRISMVANSLNSTYMPVAELR